MSIGGNMPKDPSERLNRMPSAFTPVQIKADGVVRGTELPSLPSKYGKGWCAATQRWWDMYRRSPQAKLMQDSDWEVLYSAALIHHQIFDDEYGLSPTAMVNLLAELRRREDAVGGTFEARARLRITVITDQSAEDADKLIGEVADEAVDYLERVNRAIAEKKQKQRR